MAPRSGPIKPSLRVWLVWFLLLVVLDYDWFVIMLMSVSAGVEWLLTVGVGVWNLTTLMKPEVIAGFEYKPE